MIAINSSDFDKLKQFLLEKGWTVRWDEARQGCICFRPDSEECFTYGTTEGEIDGAWAYLIHTLNLDRRPPEYWIEDKGEDV